MRGACIIGKLYNRNRGVVNLYRIRVAILQSVTRKFIIHDASHTLRGDCDGAADERLGGECCHREIQYCCIVTEEKYHIITKRISITFVHLMTRLGCCGIVPKDSRTVERLQRYRVERNRGGGRSAVVVSHYWPSEQTAKGSKYVMVGRTTTSREQ